VPNTNNKHKQNPSIRIAIYFYVIYTAFQAYIESIPVILQSGQISYKSDRIVADACTRAQPALAAGARLDDPGEPAAPPAADPRRPRGGLDHVLLQLARPARGDDRDAPAHDEHGSSR